MRLARYAFSDGPRLARVSGDGTTLTDLGTSEPLELLIGTPAITRMLHAAGPQHPLDPARLLAPVTPRQIIGVGLNYRDHAREQGRDLPVMPPVFLKSPATLNTPNSAVPVNPSEPTLDYEAELGVIVGAPLWQATEQEARAAIAGYCVVNDFTYRALAKPDTLTLAKSGPGLTPFGPWLTLAAGVPDPLDLPITCAVNGELRQASNTREMHAPPAAMLAHISQYAPLAAGDLLLTGSPGGSGLGFTPPRWLAAGDVVETRVGDLGTLRNTIVA